MNYKKSKFKLIEQKEDIGKDTKFLSIDKWHRIIGDVFLNFDDFQEET